MFNKSKPENTVTNTVIGNGITIESSRVTGNGSIRIDGCLIGELNIDGNLIIGETGHVQGDIKLNHVLIAGKMDGNAYCREGIHLASTAQLNGNIETAALVIDEGAKFTGSSQMNVNVPRGNGERNLLQRIRSETLEISEPD